jgi:uncharacterized membrane protein YbaN (DUF454 family)
MTASDYSNGPAAETAGDFGPPVRRGLLIALGWTCVGIGMVGVVTPGLPTTVFILIAAWAFARSSRRFHHWLYTHRRFGPIVRNWDEHRVIPVRAKILAIAMMTASLVFVAVFVAKSWIPPAAMFAVMAPAAAYILSRASRAPN